MAKTKSLTGKSIKLSSALKATHTFEDSYFYLPDSLNNPKLTLIGVEGSVQQEVNKKTIWHHYNLLNFVSIFLVIVIIYGLATLIIAPRPSQEAKAELLQALSSSSKSSIKQTKSRGNSNLPPIVINLEQVE